MIKEFSDLPEGMVLESVPQAEPGAPAFSDLPEGMVLESVPQEEPTEEVGWWRRKGRVAGAGLINFAANLAGSPLLSSGSIDPEKTRRELPPWLAVLSVPGVGRGYSAEEAKAGREMVGELVPESWSSTFDAEMGQKYPDLPNPFKDPGGFLSAAGGTLDLAVTQAAGNLGNVGTAVGAKNPLGIAGAALSMASQESAGFLDNWTAATGLPGEFVTGYANSYGLLSAPIEYAQNAMYAGNGAAGKLIGRLPGGKQALGAMGKTAGRVANSFAGRAMLKALGIATEGVEELSQGLIEQRIAQKMAADWNAKHPEKPVSVPAFTTEDAWQNFKAGAGMGLVFEGVRAAKGKVVQVVADKGAEARSQAAAGRQAQRTQAGQAQAAADMVAERRSAEAAARQEAAGNSQTEAMAADVAAVEATKGTEGTQPAENGVGAARPGAQIQGGQSGRLTGKATKQQVAFDREVPAGDFPLLQLVVQNNGIRKPANMSEDYGGPEGRDIAGLLYNSASSIGSDEAAAMARDAGLIREGYEDEFWDRLNLEVDQYRRMKAAGFKSLAEMAAGLEQEHEADQWKLVSAQAERWAQGSKPGEGRRAVPASELRSGDVLIVGGRRVEVNGINDELNELVLTDAGLAGYGTQTVPLDGVIHAEMVLQDGLAEDVDAREARFEQDVAGGRPLTLPASAMAVGDRVQVGPSVLTVSRVDADSGTVELDDLAGMRMYGRQSVPAGTVLAVDAFTQAQAVGDDVVPFRRRVTQAGYGGKSKTQSQQGLYHRYSESKSGSSSVPWMMFSADEEQVSGGYGQHHFVADDGNAVDSSDIEGDIEEALSINPDYKDESAALAAETSPARIVDSAGLWDNPDLVQYIWDKVLEPKGITKVRTPDGLIIFDPSDMRYAGQRVTTAGYGGGAAGTRETAGQPPPLPVGPRIDRIAADGEAADDPTFTRLPLRLHNLVDFAKQLGARMKLSAGRGGWLGRFRAVDNGPGLPGVKEVLLRHDLFKLVPDERAAQIRAEAKQEAAKKFGGQDAAAAAAMEETLFQEKFQRERQAALDKGTPEALAVAAHEIGHLVDYAPDKTLKRGNLLGHLAALKGYMQAMIQARQNAERLIPPAVRRMLDRDARIYAGKRPKENGPELDAWAERRSKAYQLSVRREAARRGLVTLEQIDEETQGLIAWWNGTPEMPDYFKSATERYAEVFSVLANNPAAVAKKAPVFWRAWNNFLKARPEAARVYDQMQEDIATGADLDQVRARIRAGFAGTQELDRAEFRRSELNNRRNLWDFIPYYFFRAQSPIDWQLIKAEQRALRENGVGRLRRWTAAGSSALAAAAERAGTGSVRGALGNFRYATTLAELYTHDMRNTVLEPMWAAGVSEVDFAEYMSYRHIVEDRPDIASTQGVDPATAKKLLKEMETQNPRGLAAMKAGSERWFATRAKHVIAALEREGMLTPEMKQTLKQREAYVTFMPVFDKVGENDPFGLVAQMAQKFGPGVTAHIGFQKGWLGGIKDPIAATMQKDRKLIRAVQRNAAARELGKFLLAQQAQDPAGRPLIAPADQEWHGKTMGTRMLGGDSGTMGDLIWIENGEANHFYIPKAYSAFLNGMPPEQGTRIIQAINAFTIVPIKRTLVDWSVGAWSWLSAKDFRAFMQQTPGVNPMTKLRGVRESFRAGRSISAGNPNDLARNIMERGLVLSRQQRSGYDADETAQQREVNVFGLMKRSEEATQNERLHVIREMGRAFADFADKFNKTMSATWKIQATQLLDKHSPNMPEWQKAEIVRSVAGNPDFLHRAAAASILDWGQLYYNAAKEGRMAGLKAFQNNPRDYVANSLIWTAAPSILMGSFGLGLVSKLLGHLMKPEDREEIEEIEEMMKWVPSYEKQRNQIIPLFWADKKMKRVAYLRLPVSEGEMPAHAFIQGMMNGEINAGSTVNAMFLASGVGGMNPGNPLHNVISAWWDYYLAQRNPYDSYRGSMLMTDDEYKAGGRYALGRLFKYTWDSFGASMVGRLPYSQSPYAPEKTPFEKVVQAPLVGATLGKWIRVSSGFDEEAKLLADKVNSREARARLDVQREVRAWVDGKSTVTPEQMAQIMGDPYKSRYMERYAKELNIRRSMAPDVRSIMDHVKNGVPDEVAMELMKRRGATIRP